MKLRANNLINFIRSKQIDSFQKLYFLLFLQQYPEMKGTSQEFAGRLYVGDTVLLENIITDLQKVDLLVATEQGWKLSAEADVRTQLQQLAGAFECPVARQELIEQVKYTS